MKFKGKIAFKSISETDPMPWWAALYTCEPRPDGGEYETFVNGQYCMSYDGAVSTLTEMKSRYLTQPDEEWIEIGDEDSTSQLVPDPRDFT